MDEMTSAFPIINERYQIQNTISAGGMAVIYRAKDLVLDRDIALKILKLELSRQPNFREQFSTEAKATAGLAHPNIITTFDFGFYGERLYIAMELIDGFLLKDIITDENVSLHQRFDYIIQACSGLSYAHSQRIVHCDIKPQNMLISRDGILKLTDFGISRALDVISRQDQSNEIWGSPQYIAPELTQGLPPSPAADVYSMGVVMYEVLTGELPFIGEDVLSLVEKHLQNAPTPPNQINPRISAQLNAIILKAMEKDPTQRFSSGKEMLKALKPLEHVTNWDIPIKNKIEQLHEKIVMTPDPDEIIEKPFNWTTVLLGFLALIMVGGLIPFWLFVYYSINR
jgi:serine/threonine-protein kinase